MVSLEEKIKIMQSCLEGKTIEGKDKTSTNWNIVKNPLWNWSRNDYRIKPESKYRPYANIEEFLKASKEHGLYIISDDWFGIPLFGRDYNSKSDIFLMAESSTESITFEDLLRNNYKWQDGTPCGILE